MVTQANGFKTVSTCRLNFGRRLGACASCHVYFNKELTPVFFRSCMFRHTKDVMMIVQFCPYCQVCRLGLLDLTH